MIKSKYAVIEDSGTFLECTYYLHNIPLAPGRVPDPNLDTVFICNQLGLEGKKLTRINKYDRQDSIVITLHYIDMWESSIPND